MVGYRYRADDLVYVEVLGATLLSAARGLYAYSGENQNDDAVVHAGPGKFPISNVILEQGGHQAPLVYPRTPIPYTEHTSLRV